MRKTLLAAIAAVATLVAGTAADAKIVYLYDSGKITTIDTDLQYVAPGGGRNYSPIPRETVKYDGPYAANTIVVSTTERRLYYVLDNGQALK